MSVIATAVKHLLAAGVTGDALVQAIAEMEADMPAVDTRSTGAKRQERYRLRLAERNKTSQSVTCDNSVTLSPTPNKSPQTPKINPTPHVCVGDAPTRKAGQFPCPDGCDPDDWRDLLANRKSKRMPLTASTYRKLIRDLAEQADEDWPPGRVLRHAAERGWAAIFDPRQSNGNIQNGQRTANDHRKQQPESPWVVGLRQAEARESH